MFTVERIPTKTYEERVMLLRGAFGVGFLQVEVDIYKQLDLMAAADYQGGFWSLYKLSNGSFYMAPATINCPVRLDVGENDYTGEVSADAAGVISCLWVFRALRDSHPHSDDFCALYNGLHAYALQHAEYANIMMAIRL